MKHTRQHAQACNSPWCSAHVHAVRLAAPGIRTCRDTYMPHAYLTGLIIKLALASAVLGKHSFTIQKQIFCSIERCPSTS